MTVPDDVAALFAACDAPLLHRQVAPSSVTRAWVADDRRSAVWLARGTTTGAGTTVATAVGDPAALGPLLDRAAREVAPPARLTVERAAADVVPQAWARSSTWSWHWMSVERATARAGTAPGQVEPSGPAAASVVLTPSEHGEVEQLLAAGNPGSFARTDTPGVLAWHGVRHPASGSLVATGCLVDQPDGSALLRGVTTHPAHRGLGLGRQVSASLTRAALRRAPVAALGVYTDNAPALAVYAGLGYEVVHTFVSGQVDPVDASSSTAAEPSR